jgi:hypothetical protein
MTLFMVLLSVLGLAVISLYFVFRKQKARSEMVGPLATTQDAEQRPRQIVIGENPSNPIITIECQESDVEFKRALPLDLQNSSIARFAAILQARGLFRVRLA